MVCCQNLVNLKRYSSPFSRIIVLGYYDGATTGALECRECRGCYRFEMVYWDEKQDYRIFGLFPLKSECFERLIDILRPYGVPRWPWFTPKWEFPTFDEKQLVEQQVTQLLSSAQEVSLVIASPNLGKEISWARKIAPKEIQKVANFDTYLESIKINVVERLNKKTK